MGISIACVVLSTFAQHNYFTSAQVKYTPSGILQKADHKTGYRKPQKTALKMSTDDRVFPIYSSNHPNLQSKCISGAQRKDPCPPDIPKWQKIKELCQHVMSYSSFSYIKNWEQESVQVLTCYIRRTLPVSQPGQVPFCYVCFGRLLLLHSRNYSVDILRCCLPNY